MLRASIDLLKRRTPRLYDFARHGVYSRIQSHRRRHIFRRIFQQNYWDGEESRSGIGSSLEATANLRSVLPEALRRLGIKSLLDIPCGDCHWMSTLDLSGIKYFGADIVDALVQQNAERHREFGQFVHLDLLNDKLPPVDAIFCRECLVHLSLRDAARAIENIKRSGARYLLTTHFPDCATNMDTVVPYWRQLNFTLAPFNFPNPVDCLSDWSSRTDGKCIAIWRIADL